MITSLHRSYVGTLGFSGLFPGMATPQLFTVHPIPAGVRVDQVTIQSPTRLGIIDLTDGSVMLTPDMPNGARFADLQGVPPMPYLCGHALLMLRAGVEASAGVAVLGLDNRGARGALGRHVGDRS